MPPASMDVAASSGIEHPQRGHRSSRITDQLWDMHKPELHKLWKNHTLVEIKAHMEKNKSFVATRRQYGYRFEKWGWKKYGEKRDSMLLPSPQTEAPPNEFLPTSQSHPHTTGCHSSRRRSSARAPSNASEISAASGNISYIGEADTELSTQSPDIGYKWGAQDEAKKLVADFCAAMFDDENANELYFDLYRNLPNKSLVAAKTMLVMSICRTVSRSRDAKRAREILRQHRSAIRGAVDDRPFVFSVLDAILEREEMHMDKSATNRKIGDILGRTIFFDNTTLVDIHHNYSVIDIFALRLLRYSLGVYEETSRVESGRPTFSTENLALQLSEQPIADIIKHDRGSILNGCVKWCAKQLTRKLKIPEEIASLSCNHGQVQWNFNLKLFCTLWNRMLELFQNNMPPPWYCSCESALGICPSELLVNVCWMIGDVVSRSADYSISSNSILQEALKAAESMTEWPDKKLWGKFYERFDWMGTIVDFRKEEAAFNGVAREHIRSYISSTLSPSLPHPAQEPKYSISPPFSSMDVDYPFHDAMLSVESLYD